MHFLIMHYITGRREYSLHTHKRSRLGQRHGLQTLTSTPYFYKNIYQKVVYVYFYVRILETSLFIWFSHFQIKFNNLKVIHDS